MSSIVTDAAIAGAGVALGRSCVVEDAIRAGQLVRPFEQLDYPKRFAYYLVSPAISHRRDAVNALRDWLLSTARSETPPYERHLATAAPH